MQNAANRAWTLGSVVMIAGSLFAFSASGATVESLQSEIDRLLGEVARLQKELAALSDSASQPPVSFTRNLTLGNSGEDVKNLQILLNKNPQTQVASSGPGSPGKETLYFGPATRSAVIKFQQLYAADILAPAGLSVGTGFVGAGTRGKLNVLIASKGESTTTSKETDVTKISSVFSPEVLHGTDVLYLSAPFSVTGKRGETLLLSGNGFDPMSNTVHFGKNVLANVASTDGTTLSFAIPKDSAIDKHTISVENSKGKSNGILFVVTNDNPTPPLIQAVSPSEGSYGQKIIITGQNFSAAGNDILSSYGIIEDIPSPDGKTLMFEVKPFPNVPELQVGVDLAQGFSIPLYFYVTNENGVSAENAPGKFVLKI